MAAIKIFEIPCFCPRKKWGVGAITKPIAGGGLLIGKPPAIIAIFFHFFSFLIEDKFFNQV